MRKAIKQVIEQPESQRVSKIGHSVLWCDFSAAS